MAVPFTDPPNPINHIETGINNFFDHIITRVNGRRMALIAIAEDKRNAKIERLRWRIEGREQLEATKGEIERHMKGNILKETQEIILREVERKLEEVRKPLPERCVLFRGEYGHVEQLIAALGEIREEEVPGEIREGEIPAVPRYEAMRPIVAAGKRGRAPGELWSPHAVAIDSITNYIYVTEGTMLSEFPRISIFSEGGMFISVYTLKEMKCPHSIAIHKGNM